MSDETKSIEQILDNLPEKEDENIGKVISNRYEVERVLGEGGMGRVYVAVQLSMSRKVALKVLHPQMLSDSRHVRRFYQEAKSASRLTSPHVVRMYDFGIDEDSGTPFIAMELLQGLPLDTMLEEGGTLPPVRAARILAQVGQALMEAHDLGIVHRDLKPENIFMQQTPDDDDFAKVMDFGIAKVLHSDTDEGDGVALTGTGMTVGTPLYMAPEQIQGGKVDPRTDMYALGCILHELVMGQPPFFHTERVPLMLMHVQEPPPPLPDVLPAGHILPNGFRELRDRMLAKKPDDRPASTGELVQELRRIAKSGTDAIAASTMPIDGATMVAPALAPPAASVPPEPMAEEAPAAEASIPEPQSVAPPAVAPSAVDTTAQALAAMESESRKSFRGGLMAGVAVALLGIGIGAFMMFGKDSGDAQSAPRGQVEEKAAAAVEKKPEAAAEKKETESVNQAKPKQVEPVKAEIIKLRIASEPAGAQVLRDGKEQGKTPLEVELEKSSDSLTFVLKAPGFEDLTIEVVPDQDRESAHALKAIAAAPKKKIQPAVKASKPQKVRKKAKKPRPARKKAQELDGLLD